MKLLLSTCFVALTVTMGMCHVLRKPASRAQKVNKSGQQNMCRLPSDAGHCKAYIPMFFHNSTSGQCEEFIYGGCGGNDNRFWERRHCEIQCGVVHDVHQCHLKPDPGPCRALIERWYYDATSGECKVFGWGGCNGNMNNFFSKSICEARCGGKKTPKCSPVVCMMDCPDGFVKDINGCETCQCTENKSTNTTPLSTKSNGNSNEKCSDVMCAMFCEHGFKKDKNGCPICECNGSPHKPPGSGKTDKGNVCSDVMCMMFCQYGFKKDEKGCPICSCEEAPVTSKEIACPYIACTKKCKAGFKKDSDGCKLCECAVKSTKPAACPKIDCHIVCPDGLKSDSNGCPICDCRASSVGTGPEHVWRGCSKAQDIMCIRQCPHGVDPDRKDCDVCVCAKLPSEHVCPPVDCMIDCPFGRETDYHGCPTCRCKLGMHDLEWQPPGCPRLQCYVPCPGGYKRDKKGCHHCECLDTGLEHESTEQHGAKVATTEKSFTQVAFTEAHIDLESQPAGCRQIQCYVPCPHGYKRDSRGCHECVCLDAPRLGHIRKQHSEIDVVASEVMLAGDSEWQPDWCPQIQCYAPCPIGYKRDNNGCHECECLTTEVEHDHQQGSTADVTTTRTPPSVKKLPQTGTSSRLESKPTLCPQVQCYMACPNGYKRNERGCYECECRETGDFEHPFEIHATDAPHRNTHVDLLPAECPQVKCRRACLHGYKTDANGCHKCDCVTTSSQKDKFGHPLEQHIEKVTQVPKTETTATLQARKIPKRCKLPPFKGPCRARKQRWYFNPISGTCEPFIYGGCRRNKNNFRHKGACLRRCVYSSRRRSSRRKTTQ